jgi:glycosyltransferase involved in cell wall biosynthesis
MRIGISTRGLNQGSYAISSIVLHLTQSIINQASNRHDIFLYFNHPEREALFPQASNKRSIQINNRFVWDHAWLPLALRADRIDVALFMKGTMPFTLPCRGAVIIHDLGYFDHHLRPYRYFETAYMKTMISRASKKAWAIFTDSEYTRTEAIRILGIHPEKITVCYQNCASIYRPITEKRTLEAIQAHYHLPSEYILSPISLSPRKNLERILDAYDEVKEQVPHHLLITGGQSWGVKDLVKRINSENNHRIHLLGAVPSEHMPALYTMAGLTIYPSILEGFGLPILEAFHCGCPVLTSNLTSMPEVAGDAAYLVDPYDTQQISMGILKLVRDEGLRRDLIAKGFERAKQFSWEKSAAIVLNRLERGEV